MCKGVVLLIKPICFCLFVRFLFYVLVGVASLYLKVPCVSCETRGSDVI